MDARICSRDPRRAVTIVLICLGLGLLAAAQTGAATPPPPAKEGSGYEDLIPPAPEGAVSWQTLGRVKTVIEDKDGQTLIRPRFDKELAALDGREIMIKGFMYPLEMAEKQSRFVLTAYPPSCPFCLHAGPSQLIEVHCATPLKFTYQPVLIKGRLELLPKDPHGLFYRMTGARVVDH
jgi:hypothetical protein